MKLLNIPWSHSKLADEGLVNFINSPNPPNFSHSKLSSFTVYCVARNFLRKENLNFYVPYNRKF